MSRRGPIPSLGTLGAGLASDRLIALSLTVAVAVATAAIFAAGRKAAAAAPRDRDALADRLRDGTI